MKLGGRTTEEHRVTKRFSKESPGSLLFSQFRDSLARWTQQNVDHTSTRQRNKDPNIVFLIQNIGDKTIDKYNFGGLVFGCIEADLCK